MLEQQEIKDIEYEIKSCKELISGVERESKEEQERKRDAKNSLLGRVRALNWVLERFSSLKI